MSSERPRYRFLSSLGAFFAATAPIIGFYLGIVAGLNVKWWLGVDLLLGVLAGFFYSRRPYSLSRLWEFVWVVWKGLVIAHVATAIIFRVNFTDIQGLGVPGRTLLGGLASVIFVVVYGAAYQQASVESA